MSFTVWWILFSVSLIAGHRMARSFSELEDQPSDHFDGLKHFFPDTLDAFRVRRPDVCRIRGTLRSRKVEDWGLLLALVGTPTCLAVSLLFRRWFSTLALGASTWVLLLFLWMGISD
jgi:hypothetical protein